MSDNVNSLIASAITSGLIPAYVDAKAAGESVKLDVAAFHPETITTAFVYGLRRMLQDHVNAAAHTFKTAKADAESKGETFNDEKPFDAAACVAARIAAFESGDMKARTGTAATFTAFEEELYLQAVKVRAASGWGTIATAYSNSKGMPTDERKRIVLAAVAALPESRCAALHATAKASLDAAEALRALDL